MDEIEVENGAKTAKKKKGGKGKGIILLLALLVIGGGGAGAAWALGYLGGTQTGKIAQVEGPKLVLKAEQKRGGAGDGKAETGSGGAKPPSGQGADKYASNYYAMDKEFTSNLQNSVHYIQIGIAVSTPYDDTVIENLKTNEIAIRSSILLALGDATESEVFTSEGKKKLAARLTTAINATLKQKEGFGGISNVYFTNFVVQ